MMRVDGAGGQRPEFPEPNRLKKKKTGSAASAQRGQAADKSAEGAFNQAFLDQAELRVTESLDHLLDELSAQGDRLQRSQTFEELERYKSLVQAFLHKLTHELYTLREAGPPPTLRGQKVNVIIEKVDQELDLLARQVLARQGRQLNILERLDEICGLLMDLYK